METQYNEKRAAIFDLDGTLLDTRRYLEKDFTLAMSRCGAEITPEAAKRSRANWYDVAAEYGISSEQLNEGFSYHDAGNWQEACENGEVSLFPEVARLLEGLSSQGVVLGLLSRATRQEDAHYKIRHFGLEKYFRDKVSIVDSDEPDKVHGALELIDSMNSVKSAYFLGDRAEDVLVADSVGRKRGLNTTGIYVNRQGLSIPEIRRYKSIGSLDGLREIIS